MRKPESRFTKKLTWDPGPPPKKDNMFTTHVLNKSFHNDLQKYCGNLRLSQKEKKHENKARLKTHNTFVGKQILIGTFFCRVFFLNGPHFCSLLI